MENPSTQWKYVVLRIEQSIPMILVFSSVLVAIFAPLSISNSHIIHMPGKNLYLLKYLPFSSTIKYILAY